MTLAGQVARAASWSLLESVGAKVVTFVVFVVLARFVAPADLGIVQMAQTVSGIVALLSEQGLNAYLVQRKEVDNEVLSTAFWFGGALATLVSALAMLAMPAVSAAYSAGQAVSALLAILALVPIGALTWVHSSLLTRELAFRALAIRKLVSVSIGGLIGVLMAVEGHGLWSLVGKLIAETVTYTVLTWRLHPWRPSWVLKVVELNALLQNGYRLTAGNLIGHLSGRADDLVIGFALGPTILGYYTIAMRAITLTQEIAIASAQKTALPVFARLQGDIPRFARTYCKGLGVTAAVSIPMFIGVSSTAQELCLVMFGTKWLPAVPTIQILSACGLAIGGSLFFQPLLLGTGRAQAFLGWQALTAAASIIALLVGTRWGLTGVAGAYVLRVHVWFFGAMWTVRAALKVSFAQQLRLLSAPGLSAAVMASAVYLMREYWISPTTSPIWTLLSLGIAGAFVYTACLFLTSPATVREAVQLAMKLKPTAAA